MWTQRITGKSRSWNAKEKTKMIFTIKYKMNDKIRLNRPLQKRS